MAGKGRQRKRARRVVWALVLAMVLFAGWAMHGGRLGSFGEIAQGIKTMFAREIPGYQGKSMIAVDITDGEVFAAKNPSEKELPASIAKLFVIDYANTLVDLDEVVMPSAGALAMVKPNSSVADIGEEPYYVKNLYAAMLVPSGNDAAYVLADYVGGKLDPDADTAEDRVAAFLSGLSKYLSEQGYQGTSIHDPSGYDYQASTTASDVEKVSVSLLRFDWFRDIVDKETYVAQLPDGETQSWEATNSFLDSEDEEYYDPDVRGIKTGTLDKDFNLVVLYESGGKEYVIVALGSASDRGRYEDVRYVMRSIDDNNQ